MDSFRRNAGVFKDGLSFRVKYGETQGFSAAGEGVGPNGGYRPQKRYLAQGGAVFERAGAYGGYACRNRDGLKTGAACERRFGDGAQPLGKGGMGEAAAIFKGAGTHGGYAVRYGDLREATTVTKGARADNG